MVRYTKENIRLPITALRSGEVSPCEFSNSVWTQKSRYRKNPKLGSAGTSHRFRDKWRFQSKIVKKNSHSVNLIPH